MGTESNTLANIGYSLKSKLIRDHEWDSNRMADWDCQLTGPNGKTITVDYHTGKGHRKIGQCAMPYRPTRDQWRMSKPTAPCLADLIHCLLLDSSASDQSFEYWCSDCGYDTDSRKALDAYLACQKAGSDLRLIGADFAQLQNILKDY